MHKYDINEESNIYFTTVDFHERCRITTARVVAAPSPSTAPSTQLPRAL